mmetsp:Transcript_55050/g.154866  ORF Transcript_55050/g.154866 Transcript_55050/m.154866 type:complete len:243 (+) Transcript_55050:679-1407(+)
MRMRAGGGGGGPSLRRRLACVRGAAVPGRLGGAVLLLGRQEGVVGVEEPEQALVVADQGHEGRPDEEHGVAAHELVAHRHEGEVEGAGGDPDEDLHEEGGGEVPAELLPHPLQGPALHQGDEAEVGADAQGPVEDLVEEDLHRDHQGRPRGGEGPDPPLEEGVPDVAEGALEEEGVDLHRGGAPPAEPRRRPLVRRVLQALRALRHHVRGAQDHAAHPALRDQRAPLQLPQVHAPEAPRRAP